MYLSVLFSQLHQLPNGTNHVFYAIGKVTKVMNMARNT
jgi:hypothetical protein